MEQNLELYTAHGVRRRTRVRQDSTLNFQPSTIPSGHVNEIIGKFGGADQLRNAVNKLQSPLYAA